MAAFVCTAVAPALASAGDPAQSTGAPVPTPLPGGTPPAPAAAPQTSPAPTAPATTWHTARRAQVRHDVHRLTSPVPHSTRPRARAASGPATTITDFQFSPGVLTVQVGDTVTWTNSGPSPHTATADNGAFDTGTLTKGASASHTFTVSGRFAYICKIHPFMKGTVVVLAGSAAPAANHPGSAPVATATVPSPGPATPTAGSGSAGNPSRPTLPVTGLDLPAVVAAGLGLLTLGRLMRRRGI